jgi:hypothetical protein
MLALMILYTFSSIWILSQPMVEDDTAGSHVRASASAVRDTPDLTD